MRFFLVSVIFSFFFLTLGRADNELLNNSCLTAESWATLNVGNTSSSISGTVPRTDVDYYSLSIGQSGFLSINATSVDNKIEFELYQFNLLSCSLMTPPGTFTLPLNSYSITQGIYRLKIIHTITGNGQDTYTDVTATLSASNHPPTASDTSITTNEDILKSGSLPSASDIDGDPITYSLDTQALHGIAAVASNGNYTYTPSANYNGSDTFKYSVSDNKGGSNTYTVSVTITPVNDAPTNITLSNASIAENSAVNTLVGTFTTTDPEAGNTFTYSLVSGSGSTDNASFTISGGQLQTNAIFDFETKNSYSIRVRTTDQEGLSYDRVFTISVNDVIELAGNYRMDECSWNGTANEVIDSSGNGYHGSLKNKAMILGSGIINNAPTQFNNDSYIELPTFPNLTSNMTITAWFKTTNINAAGQRIFEDDASNSNGYAISVGDGGSGRIRFFDRSQSGAGIIDSDAILQNNTWYFVAAVVDISGARRYLYVYDANGNLINQKNLAMTNTARGNDTGIATIGGETNAQSESTYRFKGSIDEIKIFTSPLSQTQIGTIAGYEKQGLNYDGTSRTPSCCCLPTGGNLIANPSFETLCASDIVTSFPGTAGGTANLRNGLCGWQIAYFIETWENTTAPVASDGAIFTEIDGNGGQVDKIWQTLNTVAGTNYIISFDYRKRDTSHSDVIIAKWNDVAVTQVEGNTAGWQTAQIQVTGTAGTDKISFEEPSTSDDGYGSWIDNIRVEQGTLATDCTSFKYEPYHSYNTSLTPSYRLQTRIANQPFDVNVTVACTDSGTIPSRKIKNIYAIDALATSCNATTPKLFTLLSNGAYDINETNRVITIPNLNITKAYSNIKLMLETNSSELYCSSDSFAIRPPSFSITSPTGSTKAAAFTLQISALDSGTGYNGTANVTTGLQAPNPNCPVSSGFLKSSISPTEPFSLLFQNDNNSSTAKATDVGIIYLNTKDSTWTATDQSNDCIVDSNTTIMNMQGLLGCNIENNLSLSITPDHFDVNATLSNFGGGFTYLSNDLNMSAKLDLIITAENDENITTQNYTYGCYSKDTTVTLLHSTVPSPLSKILYHDSITLSDTNITVSNPITSTYNSSKFNQGSVTPHITFNFDRNVSTPLNPFDFNFNSATATDPDATGAGTPLGTAQFVYGRIRAYDIASNISPVDVPIEFEVYSTTSGGFVSGMPQNVLHWYRNLNHDAANQGNVIQGGFSAGTSNGNIDVTTAPQEGIQIINVTSTADQTVHLDISKWLWYSSTYGYLYSGACTQHPCFKYDYTDANAGVNGVNSGTFNGSDFEMTPAKNITNKGVKLFR